MSVISTSELFVFSTKNHSKGFNVSIFGTIETRKPLSNFEKLIPSPQFEKEILDNNAGVETTFHHGVSVIVIHVASARLYVPISHTNIPKIDKHNFHNLFMKIFFIN